MEADVKRAQPGLEIASGRDETREQINSRSPLDLIMQESELKKEMGVQVMVLGRSC